MSVKYIFSAFHDLNEEDKKVLQDCFCDPVGKHFHIITHVTPDGDTIGAAAGLAAMIASATAAEKAMDTVTIYGEEYDTRRFGYIFDTIRDAMLPVDTCGFQSALPDKFTENDVVICVDSAVRKRLGVVNPDVDFAPAKVIVFDHHESSDAFGDVNVIDSGASSCCELIVKFLMFCLMHPRLDKFSFKFKGWQKNRAVCEAFYTGMCTDTLGFQTDKVSCLTYECLAYICDTVRHEMIGYRLWSNTPEDVMRYQGFVMLGFKRTRVLDKVNVTHFVSTPDTDVEFSRLTGHHVTPTMKTLVVSSLRRVEGTDIAISVSENCKGLSKISVRVLGGKINASDLMRRIGGGGHASAAGAVVEAPADKALDLVIENLKYMLG